MIKFSRAIQLLSLIYNEPLEKAEAIVCLEGDGYTRLKQTARLFKGKWGRVVVISGGYDKPPFSVSARKLKLILIKRGVPSQKIILEEKSEDTYEQAKEVMKLVGKRKWRKIILVASHFHQLRAFLTFLKAMEEMKMKIQIFNAPVRKLFWFKKTSLGLTRFQLLTEELKKIKKYSKKNHLVSFQEAIDYQKWKEKQG